MRLTRLNLVRYGHFTEVELRFPPAAGLHVVLGANEAGKSTALAAVADALFGFPMRTRHAYLHDMAELRIDFDLLDRDGREHHFVRLKRRTNDLADAAGNPLPAATLGAILGSCTREGFHEMFGLDGERLRKGGASILEGGGEVGRALFSAASGLTGAQAALAKLDAEADALFTKRRSANKPFYVAVDAHRSATKERNERALPISDYEKVSEALATARQTIAEAEREKRGHEAARSRLERIRRTLPALRARADALDALAGIDAVPTLPLDAAELMRSAGHRRETATQLLAELWQQRQELAALPAADPADAALLAAGKAIEALERKLQRAEAATADRPEQEAIAANEARRIEALAARLGLGVGEQADTIVARSPSDAARGRLRRLVSEHAALSERRQQTQEAAAARQREAERAAQAAAALAALPDSGPLRAAVQQARDAGRIDDDIAHAADEVAGLRRRAERSLAALAPAWPGDIAGLRAAAVPSAAELRRHQKALDAAAQAMRDATTERVALDRALAEAGDRIRAAGAAGPLPTAEAIGDARRRRDHAWRLLRRHRLEAGAAPNAEELGPLPGLPLPEALEQLTREADSLADRRGEEAQRLEQYRQALEDQVRAEAALARVAPRVAIAAAEQDAAQVGWRTAWAGCGLSPAEPAIMAEWQKARETAVDAADALAAQEALASRLAAKRLAALTALRAALPELPAEARLAPLLHVAEERLRQAQEVAAAGVAARAKATEAQTASEDAALALAKAQDALTRWQGEWDGALGAASLLPGTSPLDAEAALRGWDEAAEAARAMQAARVRVAEMTDFLAGFAAEVAPVVATAAPGLAGLSPVHAAQGLLTRLGPARARAREAVLVARRLGQVDADIGRREREREAAEDDMARLRTLAGVAEDAALTAAIELAERHRQQSAALAAAVAALQRDGDGLPVDNLVEEAAGKDPDQVAAEISAMQDRLAELDRQVSEQRQREGKLEEQIETMRRGRDSAEAAQRAADAAATAVEVAQRYARLHVARSLLREALSRFRAEQQGPLLRRAGTMFEHLTLGRYARLEAEEQDDGTQRLVAVTAERSRCPADALSEGTRDQLYLALRLAALEEVAAGSGVMPFLADDLLTTFDDDRTRAAIEVLAAMSETCQVILFTHHRHVAELVRPSVGQVQVLAGGVTSALAAALT
jgi:chromosome segregation protein